MNLSMQELPFELPRSIASYLDQFEEKPEKTIKRFKKQLKRRGQDAVGYFILGWFYYRQDNQEKAIECALKAKTLAPGSPFFEKLHFYFSHPQLFDARYIPSSTDDSYHFAFTSQSDLDSLIEKLTQIESTRIKVDSKKNGTDNSKPYDAKEVDGIVSETLAKVHEQQGNAEEAIRIYKILKGVKREKADYYNKRITQLKQFQAQERSN